MKLKRVFEQLSDLTAQGMMPQGILDEGRIFSLGLIVNEENMHGRVTEVIEGLKHHVGQPFGMHSWVFTYDLSTFEQDGIKAPMTFVGVVVPNHEGSVTVTDYIATAKDLRFIKRVLFEHTISGTALKLLASRPGDEDAIASSFYPPAIAILNTRGCSIDLKRAPQVINQRLKRQGKHLIPAHYNIDAGEYFTALRSSSKATQGSGTHASPIPHLRRAHERILGNGQRVWVRSALINVRNEGDIAFVERRKGYKS